MQSIQRGSSAPFSEWVGDRIGNFGGVDTGHLCMVKAKSGNGLRDSHVYREIRRDCRRFGNSIPEYVPDTGYLAGENSTKNARRMSPEL